ncbi:MAG: hypothetical protein K9J37_23000 [Saprospiraceae bacterium]|nr:hypothetical protein [Saprospiraceae bacterium]MCF8252795.1 hypothetical protein [Saprospiraceae bacterium]MCF8283226.1 hypothetical protein [Bacteroidales bacterium]MCF8314350.1 hypothetical protein [Saprospiraceae bacterium]MCF8443227.1 hypothetical protein [Saprospiraceae bacterium]
MKKKVLLLALLPILLAAYLFSCQNSADGTDELLSIDAKNLISPPENGGIGLRSGSGFEDSIDILYLGTIDIISDTTLRTAIKNKALVDSIDGEVGFDYIQSIATANSINLISLRACLGFLKPQNGSQLVACGFTKIVSNVNTI